MSKKIILFFIAGPIPTKEEKEAAEKLGTSRFRNALLVKDSDSLEKCDAVAGSVPEIYKKSKDIEVLDSSKKKEKKDSE